jgi:hypothetical protein
VVAERGGGALGWQRAGLRVQLRSPAHQRMRSQSKCSRLESELRITVAGCEQALGALGAGAGAGRSGAGNDAFTAIATLVASTSSCCSPYQVPAASRQVVLVRASKQSSGTVVRPWRLRGRHARASHQPSVANLISALLFLLPRQLRQLPSFRTVVMAVAATGT